MDADAVDAGDEGEHPRVELDREPPGGEVLVDDRIHTLEAARAAGHRDAAAPAGDHQVSGRDEVADGAGLDDPERLGRGDDPPPPPPGVVDDLPAAARRELQGPLPSVEGADRLGRRPARHLGVHDRVGDHRDHRDAAAADLVEGHRQHAPEQPLGHRPHREERLGRDLALGLLLLKREGADLGTVAVADRHPPARVEQCGGRPGEGDRVLALLRPGTRLSRGGEGVAAQRQDRRLLHAAAARGRREDADAHCAPPPVVCMIGNKALKIVHAGELG